MPRRGWPPYGVADSDPGANSIVAYLQNLFHIILLSHRAEHSIGAQVHMLRPSRTTKTLPAPCQSRHDMPSFVCSADTSNDALTLCGFSAFGVTLGNGFDLGEAFLIAASPALSS